MCIMAQCGRLRDIRCSEMSGNAIARPDLPGWLGSSVNPIRAASRKTLLGYCHRLCHRDGLAVRIGCGFEPVAVSHGRKQFQYRHNVFRYIHVHTGKQNGDQDKSGIKAESLMKIEIKPFRAGLALDGQRLPPFSCQRPPENQPGQRGNQPGFLLSGIYVHAEGHRS